MSGTQQLLLTEGGGAAPNYIEDVFSTYLYTGNGTGQTITNNIDLATEGGLVWIKDRTVANGHALFDTNRGVNYRLNTASTNGNDIKTSALNAFTTTGFTVGTDGNVNTSASKEVSWTFRKQPKFFDVVTYTGNGTAGRTIAHSLGSVPGCIIVKKTSAAQEWAVYHRSLANTEYMVLNTTAAVGSANYWNSTTPTSSVFSVSGQGSVNENGATYVAYLFAHNAGGFGLTGTDNVISCGSFTTDGSGNALLNLGYEPQWFLAKSSSTTQDWVVVDSMRGWVNGGANDNDALLRPNLSNIEFVTNFGEPTATGFNLTGFSASQTYIYISIRRGPMKVPTDATKVFTPTASSDGTGTQITTGFPVSMQLNRDRSNNDYTDTIDRLRGISTNSTEQAYTLETSSTAAEAYTSNLALYWNNTGFQVPNTYGFDPKNAIYWSFQRAPSFFDEVCYTGTGVARTVTHNLGVAPELMIVKKRDTTSNWAVYSQATGNTHYLILNQNFASASASTYWNNTSPTSTVFTVATSSNVNTSGGTYVAYLFATCAGVSKVGSYTGTGTLTTINCGFTGGARFVLIKRTDSTSDWFVWDTARGMVAGTDPSLALNSISAESNANSVYTATTGFQLLASPSKDVNTNGGTYIYLAIA